MNTDLSQSAAAVAEMEVYIATAPAASPQRRQQAGVGSLGHALPLCKHPDRSLQSLVLFCGRLPAFAPPSGSRWVPRPLNRCAVARKDAVSPIACADSAADRLQPRQARAHFLQPLAVPVLLLCLQMQQLARGTVRTACQQLTRMVAVTAPSRPSCTSVPRLAAARAATPAMPLVRLPVAPRSSAGLLASVRLQRAICVAVRAQQAAEAAAAEHQQQDAAAAAATFEEQEQEQEERQEATKDYVIVNFFHLVDLERPWEVRCQPAWLVPKAGSCACSVAVPRKAAVRPCPPHDTAATARGTTDELPQLKPAAAVHPTGQRPALLASLLAQIINASKEWMEGRDVRGRIYFSEQARHAA